MKWTKRLTQLNDILGELVPYKEGIAKFINAAGLKPQMINFSGNALDVWCNVIDEANKQNKVNDLIEVIRLKYPDNPFLIAAQNEEEINYSLSPNIEEKEWQSLEEGTLEVLTMGNNTLLPINFLAKGINLSRSVAKVEINRNGGKNVGTGFLFKVNELDELFFMTNFHVISNRNDFKNTRVIFDYEEDINGNSKASKSFNINENGPLYLSSVAEYDVAIFKCNS